MILSNQNLSLQYQLFEQWAAETGFLGNKIGKKVKINLTFVELNKKSVRWLGINKINMKNFIMNFANMVEMEIVQIKL